MKKFIIDADTGSDDAVAILLALQDPTVEVLGISVVSGNVPLKQGIMNTISTIDTSDLVGGVGIDTIGKSEKELEEPSTWEKLEYGFDKETWVAGDALRICLLYTSPSPRDRG